MFEFLKFKKKKKLHRNEAIIFGRPGNSIIKEAYTRLKDNLPKKGSIRCMKVTEKQYASMEILVGRKTIRERKIDADQLSLF